MEKLNKNKGQQEVVQNRRWIEWVKFDLSAPHSNFGGDSTMIWQKILPLESHLPL